ncbi:MAG: hypothetical protein EA398_09710 [Deltaproteobacteria bacterium]|nr:MAG: hypothetical protein EA398_09710 [Deltaproteobacteria bacterium]
MSDNTNAPARASINARLTRFASEDDFVAGYHPYFVRGGMLLKSRSPLPVGTDITFQVRIADDQVVMTGEGRIKQHRRDAEGKPVAAVIQFTRLDRSSKALYDRMIAARQENPRLSGPHAAVTGPSPAVSTSARAERAPAKSLTAASKPSDEKADLGGFADELASSLDSIFDEIGGGTSGSFSAVEEPSGPSLSGREDRRTGDHTPPGGSTSTLFGLPRFAEGQEAARLRDEMGRPATVSGIPASPGGQAEPAFETPLPSPPPAAPAEETQTTGGENTDSDLSLDEALDLLGHADDDGVDADGADAAAEEAIASAPEQLPTLSPDATDLHRDTVPDMPVDESLREAGPAQGAARSASQIDTARHDVSALLRSLTGEHEAVPTAPSMPDIASIGAGHAEEGGPTTQDGSAAEDEDALLAAVVGEDEGTSPEGSEEGAEDEEPKKKGFWSRLFGK